MDAGAGPDGGRSIPDSGAPTDAGTPPDAGTSSDAGTLAGGATRWVKFVSTPDDDQVLAVTGASDGTVIHLENFGSSQIRLGTLDSAGNALWNRLYPGRLVGAGISVTLNGGFLIWGYPAAVGLDFGGGRIYRSFIAQLDAEGAFVRYLQDCTNVNDVCGSAGARQAPNGDFVWLEFSDKFNTLFVYHPDGQVQQIGHDFPTAFAVAPDSTIAVATGIAYSPLVCGNQTFSPDESVIAKFRPDGTCLWGYALPQGVSARYIGISAVGTVVATAVDLSAGAITLYVLESDGTLRWTKSVDAAVLAVDPSGRVALTPDEPSTCSNATHVSYYDLAGDYLWRRDLSSTSCLALPPTALATLPNHAVLVGGTFAGAANLGAGVTPAQGEDGFILALVP